MLDPTTLTALASSTVAVLTPLLKKALDKGVEEIGKSSAEALVDKLKQRINHGGVKDALNDLSSQPNDSAARGALEMQFRKALVSDPDLVDFLKEWLATSEPVAGVRQKSNVTGDNNKTTQIAGSGNNVSQ